MKMFEDFTYLNMDKYPQFLSFFLVFPFSFCTNKKYNFYIGV